MDRPRLLSCDVMIMCSLTNAHSANPDDMLGELCTRMGRCRCKSMCLLVAMATSFFNHLTATTLRNGGNVLIPCYPTVGVVCGRFCTELYVRVIGFLCVCVCVCLCVCVLGGGVRSVGVSVHVLGQCWTWAGPCLLHLSRGQEFSFLCQHLCRVVSALGTLLAMVSPYEGAKEGGEYFS